MALYMMQFSYTSQAVSELVRSPQDRAEIARSMAEQMGARLEAFYFTFGDYDGVAIIEGPDNVSMAAASMALSASGAFKAVKTTLLIPMNEAVEAMRKAGAAGYRPPGG